MVVHTRPWKKKRKANVKVMKANLCPTRTPVSLVMSVGKYLVRAHGYWWVYQDKEGEMPKFRHGDMLYLRFSPDDQTAYAMTGAARYTGVFRRVNIKEEGDGE